MTNRFRSNKLRKAVSVFRLFITFVTGFVKRNVEIRLLATLNVLSDSQKPLGGKVTLVTEKNHGIESGEREVRYYLKPKMP